MTYISLSDFKKLENTQHINFDSTRKLDSYVRGISIDSRTMKSGDIFWSIKGENFDGHNFVADAIKKEASAIVVESKYSSKFQSLDIPVIVVNDTLKALQNFSTLHRNKYRIPFLGITGTNGKTTTKEMINWILQSKYNVLKTKGNYNNLIGVPLTLLRLKSEHQLAVIEMGTNQPGEIQKLVQIAKPNAALITNIGRGHLQNFSSIDGLAEEKIELFKGINDRGKIFLNQDDKRLPKFKRRKKTLWSYSLENRKARVRGKFVDMDEQGNGIWELNDKVKIRMKIPGMHHVQNALAASSVALYFGFDEKEIRDALQEYKAYDKRMQTIQSNDIIFINDTYNANPDSFLPALNTLKHIADKNKSRKVVVMGDMLELGLESENIHHNLIMNMLDFDISGIFTMGKICDVVVHDLKQRGYENIFWFKDHNKLALALNAFLKKGDYCLLKGSRGMQMEKVLGYI
jgi:UDP-N-acetylmuramoyl-tripeptide--D-alanyl-D-alanine ligase